MNSNYSELKVSGQLEHESVGFVWVDGKSSDSKTGRILKMVFKTCRGSGGFLKINFEHPIIIS